ncbi:MAG: hypothetical protein AAF721_15925 [Myxococcota bacterium]
MGALYRDVYDDVVRCAQRKRERDTLRRRLQSARGQLATQSVQLTRLADELAKQEEDIRRLEGRSLLALVAQLARPRRRGRRLDSSRQHAIATRARHDAQAQTVAALHADVKNLERQLSRYAGLDAEYQRVFLDKARDLVTRGGPTGARVAELSAVLVDARGHARELDEAITAGQATLRSLLSARRTFGADDGYEDGHARFFEADRRAERHLADGQLWAFRFARELEDLEPWSAGGQSMRAVAGLMLHYVDDLVRNAVDAWSPSRTRAAMDGLRGYVELQLRALERTRASVLATHDATEQRYIEVVAFG